MQDTAMEHFTENFKNPEKLSRLHILKNLGILSLGGLLFFTSYDGLLVLQSTINGEEGMGTTSMAIQFACSCISSLLFPKYLITKFGSKNVIIVSMLTFLPFVASNFYPTWVLMIGSSAILGVGWSLLWGSQCSHLNDLSQLYSTFLSTSGKHQQSKHNLVLEEMKRSAEPGTGIENVPVYFNSKVNYESSDKIKPEIEKDTACFESYNSFHIQRQDTLPDCATCNASEITNHESSNNQIIFNPNNMLLKSIHETNTTCDKHRTIQVSECRNDSYFLTTNNINGNGGKLASEFQTVPLDSNNHSEHLGKPNLAKIVSTTNVLESTTARFFGFHSMMYQSCYVWSNLLSFYVLKSESSDNFLSNSTCSCGADFCNVESECTAHNLQPPSAATRQTLLAIFIGLNLFAMVLLLCFLDQIKEKDRRVSMSLHMLLATCKRSIEKHQFLLIPLTIYIGMGQGFYIGDFTKSYIGCAWGVQHVGLVTICSGVTMAMSSTLSGWFVKHLGRLPIFLLAETINVIMSIILILWRPDPQQPIMFFVASGLWGILFGMLWSQLRAFYGVLFKKDEEAAFGSYQFWHSAGSCLSLSYSNSICTLYKIYILIAISSVGIVGYLLVERSHSQSKSEKDGKA